MKQFIRVILMTLLTAAFLAGCKDEPVLPTSDFTFDPTEITIYDEVTFTNASTDADSYAWDFGDGTTSYTKDPVHVYKTAGTYMVKLVASNADGSNESTQTLTVNAPHNYYTINGTEYTIDSEMFWYTSPMGGDPYIRLLTAVPGQDNPDLLKLYPNKGLADLAGTYTWDPENPVGTYEHGYTFNYAGMVYDSTAIGKAGSGDLVITELDAGVYKFEAEMVMSIGNYDWNAGGVFYETSTGDLKLEYIGGITPL
jgi:hypothetical protein